MKVFKLFVASTIVLPILCFCSSRPGQVSVEPKPANTTTKAETLDSTIVPGRLIQNADPKYPDQASKEKVQGVVELEATIDKDGSVTNVAIDNGDLMLADAAVDAVREWKFEPYTKDGRPVEVWQKLVFNFVASQKVAELEAQLPLPILATSLFRVERPMPAANSPTIKVGAGAVVSPKALVTPDPKYTIAANKAKHQGTCVMNVVIGTDGQPHDIKIIRAVGLGLDAKAVEAVSKWKFQPGMKNGIPVITYATIQVNFRLY